MSKITVTDLPERTNWNARVSHPLQSYEWGEFREKTGVKVLRLYDQSTPYQLTLHTIPKLPFYIGYLPKGPAITKQMIQTLYQYGKKHNVIFFQLEPNIEAKNADTSITDRRLLPSHHPLFTKHTFVIDLTQSEETLLNNMHAKTRYNIKVAQKHEVQIKQDNSPQAFQEYLRLVTETTQRQGFYAHSLAYHKQMWETLAPHSIAQLWTASYNKEVLAAWVLFLFKDTIYYPYGASSRNFRNVMAPNLLLWEIVQWGKKNGYKKFDLWGALGPDPKEDDPFFGFHRFKSGFNPTPVTFIGSYDIVVNPLLYKVYCFADTIRWKVLKKK